MGPIHVREQPNCAVPGESSSRGAMEASVAERRERSASKNLSDICIGHLGNRNAAFRRKPGRVASILEE